MKLKVPKWLNRRLFLWCFGVVLTVFLVWAFVVEPRTLFVRQYELEAAEWGRAELRIAFLGDFHFAPGLGSAWQRREIVRKTLAEKPDIIVFIGDFVNGLHGRTGNIPMTELASFLKEFKAPLGCWAVLGNHEFWYGPEEVAKTLTESGVQVLSNDCRFLEWHGEPFYVAGFEDVSTTPAHNLRILRQVPKGMPGILLMHSPDSLPLAPVSAVVSLAGHTHGGQVRLPFFGSLATGMAARRYHPGLHTYNGKRLVLTAGIGTSFLPIRFWCPPEIVMVTLKSVKTAHPATI